ncbi:MAG: glycosyltransferase N-terminal domain-containing protein [Fulvivirga sp.]
MALIFYRFSLLIYRFGATVLALFSPKARLFVKGRRRLTDKIKKKLSNNNAPIVWFHCASLGEFEQGRPIIEKFKSQFTNHKILLTFFSPSGYEVRKDYEHADYIFYLPWDSKSSARKFIDIVKPDIALFVKYEYWHFFIKTLKDRNIPIISTSSIFRPDQIYFKPYGWFYLNILKNVTYFFAQNRATKLLLEKHGVNQVSISGDTRFDRVAAIAKNKKELPQVKKFKANKKIMVVGSCWSEDIEVLLPFINASDMKFIIAPHEIEGGTISKLEKECMRKTIRYSKLEESIGDEDVLLVDNIGLLSNLYAYGEYAFVGGAFGAGLHNILEAATYGVPIFFGNKNYKKFNEAVELINLGGAVAVGSYTELQDQFAIFMEDTAIQIAGQVNMDYVKDNTGATDKIFEYCKKLIQP